MLTKLAEWLDNLTRRWSQSELERHLAGCKDVFEVEARIIAMQRRPGPWADHRYY